MPLCSICKKDTSNTSAIACGVCFVPIHASCLGFKGPDCDKIMKHTGIKFFCSTHESVSPSALAAKFRKLKMQFDVLTKHFSEMQTIFSDEKLLFENASYSEVASQTVESSENPIFVNVDESKSPLDKTGRTRASKRRFDLTNNFVENKKQKKSPLNVNANNVEPSDDARVDVNAGTSNVGNSSNESEIITVEDELVVLDPPKVVFLSNFSKDTGAEKIQNYISKKGILSSTLNVTKLNLPDDRNYSSFKIFVRDDILFETLLKRDFWPRNTFVKQFLRRVYQAEITD